MNNSNTNTPSDGRIHLYDNVKAILILMVVIGHFFEPYVTKFRLATVLFTFIYTFHMPAFLFVSGLLKKEYGSEAHFNRTKFLQLIIAGYSLKILLSFSKHLLEGTAEFSLLTEDGIPWFLFVLAGYELIVFILRGLDKRVVFIVSILIAAFAGYDASIGDWLCLSRFTVYLPFYLAGYYLSPKKVLDFTRKIYIRILSFAVLAAYGILCIIKTDRLYAYRRLFTGRNSFSKLNGLIDNCGFDDRLFVMLLAALLTFSLISVMPDSRLPVISFTGTKTLQIYFWHRIFLLFIDKADIFGKLTDLLGTRPGKYTYLLFAVLLTILLTAPLFAHPTKGIFRKPQNEQTQTKT